MFRRQPSAPGRSRPRRPTRQRAAPAGADSPPELEFAAKIESGVRGLLVFFRDAALIVARFVYAPHRFDRAADERGRLSSAVPPLTFLTL